MKKTVKNWALFTLIELLVVVAIIAVLASMLLPALGTARAKAQATSCINHMKQISLGLTMYVNDNDGVMPTNYWSCEYSRKIEGYMATKSEWGDTVGMTVSTQPKGAFICPSANATGISGGTATVYCPTYSPTYKWPTAAGTANSCWIRVGSDWSTIPVVRLDNIASGSCIIADMNLWKKKTDGRAECENFIGNYYTMTSTNAPGFLHNNSSNFMFQDGSVIAIKYAGGAKFLDDNYRRK